MPNAQLSVRSTSNANGLSEIPEFRLLLAARQQGRRFCREGESVRAQMKDLFSAPQAPLAAASIPRISPRALCQVSTSSFSGEDW